MGRKRQAAWTPAQLKTQRRSAAARPCPKRPPAPTPRNVSLEHDGLEVVEHPAKDQITVLEVYHYLLAKSASAISNGHPHMILQKNTVSLKTRQVHYYLHQDGPPSFSFDKDGQRSTITDQGVCQALLQLGDGELAWGPVLGQRIKYTFGGHTYDAEVVDANAHSLYMCKGIDLSLLADAIPCDKVNYCAAAAGLASDARSQMLIKNLADLHSSRASGFTYDAAQCHVCIRPAALHMWLEVAFSQRGYTHARLVLHGSSDFNALLKDPRCFDPAHGGSGIKGYGMYCAFSDHLFADYSTDPKHGPTTHLLGLLLQKDDAKSGAYETYGLRPTWRHNKSNASLVPPASCHNAVIVRDKDLFLPIGVAALRSP